ncbi:chalcone isomerase family protein [Rhodoferax sp.]|uniref:chalcone isomerase family protein n=1 Tax=Rhodoferax sp. TaxID=50421 RepID=UPI001EBC4574|nr:chalcone isomerase family protein [Rhodoferax sp.]MBT9508341.1 chalcone isomerase family protein [Rhodoferax sp.]
MKYIKRLAFAVITGLLAFNTLAATLEINGVKVEDTATVNGVKLGLNGAGTRYKGPFKGYVAGLYSSKKASSLEEVVNQPGPKRMTITLLREFDANELGKLLTRGMEDNMGKAAMSKLIPGLMRMSQIFSDQKKLAAGDNFMIEWIPGAGSVITVKGKAQGEPFKEPEFFMALMSIWLGPSPADWKLKDALLNIK